MVLSWQPRPSKSLWKMALSMSLTTLGLQVHHLALAGAAQHEQRHNQPDDGQASDPTNHAANNGPSVAAATPAVVGGCADAVLQHTAA